MTLSNKYCAVPQCKNTATKTPEKLFFYLPKNPTITRKWTNAMRRAHPLGPKTVAYCCEDHFDMWKTVLPGTCGRWEPMELRVLKRSLANLNCVCKTCTRHSPSGSELYDVGVQASHSGVLDRFIQVTPKDSLTIRPKDSTHFKQQFCPSCYVTYTLLRSGGTTRIFKDEEIETKIEKQTCNKSTEHVVVTVEKTTSVTNKPVLKFSNMSLYASSDSSQAHSDRAVWNAPQNNHSTKDKNSNKKNSREVTFFVNENFIHLGREPSEQDADVLNPLREEISLSSHDLQCEDFYSKKISRYRDEPYIGPENRKCVCADELIRAIRPPFTNDW